MPFLDLRIAQLHLRCTNPATLASPFGSGALPVDKRPIVTTYPSTLTEATIHCSTFAVRSLVALLKLVHWMN